MSYVRSQLCHDTLTHCHRVCFSFVCVQSSSSRPICSCWDKGWRKRLAVWSRDVSSSTRQWGLLPWWKIWGLAGNRQYSEKMFSHSAGFQSQTTCSWLLKSWCQMGKTHTQTDPDRWALLKPRANVIIKARKCSYYHPISPRWWGLLGQPNY